MCRTKKIAENLWSLNPLALFFNGGTGPVNMNNNIIRYYFLLKKGYAPMKFSRLANSALNLVTFLQQNKQKKDGAWAYSTKFHHLLLNTNYVACG